MELGAILLLLALLVGIGLYLAAPLMRGATKHVPDQSTEASALMAERDRIINSLQELDFDFKLGKIPEEVYPEQRSNLLKRGATILRQLDEIIPDAQAAGEKMSGAEERIQRAAAGDREPLGDDRIESMLAARRAARRGKSAGFCPRCGKPVLVSDRFCPHCGKSLA